MLARLADPAFRPLAERANVLLPGLYAWATTVAAPASALRATETSRACAFAALLALVLGPWFASRRPKLARLLGIYGFVGFSVVAWALLSRANVVLGVEPIQATFGAMGWVLYTFGWGELRGRGQVPEDDPGVIPGAPLPPRAVLHRSVELVFALGLAGVFAMLLLAFRVSRPTHALMGQAVTLIAGLLIVHGASQVALERGARSLPSNAERTNAASTALAALFIALGLGALWLLLGR
ncbi:MAG TPA: hypothetical protein VER33_16920 [Polyangiaceae bacterium]|nr:hypothetical protein [Polyangiaceae bacterium]